MRRIIFLLILSIALAMMVSCAECTNNESTSQCDLYRGFIPEAQNALNNPDETDENKNAARRLLGMPTVQIQDEVQPTPPPIDIIPQSPLRQIEYKYEESCTWMGCAYEFTWGE